MRSLLFTILAACGGGGSKPTPVSNQPPPVEKPAPIAEAKRCEERTAKCAVATMEVFSNQMCACTDKACADKVNEEMAAWGTEMANTAGAARDEKPDPELAKKSADIMTRYTECMTKLFMGATPPPDPCGGGADPCGG